MALTPGPSRRPGPRGLPTCIAQRGRVPMPSPRVGARAQESPLFPASTTCPVAAVWLAAFELQARVLPVSGCCGLAAVTHQRSVRFLRKTHTCF